MRYTLTLAIVSLIQGTVLSQSTWHVDVTGVSPGDGSSGSPYTAIQYAIEQSSTLSGDTILVRPGAYVENVDFIGKDIALRSTDGPVATIVTPGSASGMPAVSLVNGEGPGAVLRGFTLTGGNPLNERGGAIYCVGASPRVVDCVVKANHSLYGVVWAESASLELIACEFIENDSSATGFLDSVVTLEDCRFRDNVQYGAPGAGSWVTSSDVSFTGCEFLSNEGTFGSAIFAGDGSDLEVEDCRFDTNTGFSAIYARTGSLIVENTEFTNNRADFDGGGAAYVEDCVASFSDCAFLHNSAGADDYRGGAIYGFGSDLTVTDSIFHDNFSARGGAAYTDGGSARYEGCWFEENRALMIFCCNGGSGGAIGTGTNANVVAERCVFVRNRADGPASSSGYSEGWGGAVIGGVSLLSCTLVDNYADDQGGAAFGATLLGCIVVGSEPEPLAGGASADYSNIEGGATGTGNIDAASLFIDARNDNYHLAPGSPCIDAGDRNSPPDLDGSRADMGAFDFVDCNGNGLLDAVDIATGTSLDLNLNGFPDECECLAIPYCETSPHSAGPGAVISLAGSASVSENDLVLVAGGCPPSRPGVFFYGTGAGASPFGDGVRCVFGQTYRLGLLHTSLQGIAAHALDNQNPPGAAGQITVGSRWYFQFWFRDPGGPGGTGFNLSDGLEVVFCP